MTDQQPVTQPMQQVIAGQQPIQQPQTQPQPATQPIQQPQAQPAQPEPPKLFTPMQPQPQPQPQQQPAQPTPDTYQTIIAQQQAQIDALIAQTNAQSAQITQMVQNGAQFQQAQQAQPAQYIPQQQPAQAVQFPGVYQPTDNQAHPLSTFNPASLTDDVDYSLESLASEIGRRNSDGASV